MRCTSGAPSCISARVQRSSSATSVRAAGPSVPRGRSSALTPWRSQSASGTYSRPRRVSIDRSCQKLASCSAVQIASDSRSDDVADAVQVQQQAADRVGRAPAVVEHLGPIRVARLHDVLAEGVEQVESSGTADGGGRSSPPAARRPPASAATLRGPRRQTAGRRRRPATRSGVPLRSPTLRRPGRRRCARRHRSRAPPAQSAGGHSHDATGKFS